MRRRLVWVQDAKIFFRLTMIVGPFGLNNFNTTGQGRGLVSLTAVPFDYDNAVQTVTYLGTTGQPSPPEPTGTTLQSIPGTIEFIAAARQQMRQQLLIPSTALTGDTVNYSIQIAQQGLANGNRHMAFITAEKDIIQGGITTTTMIFQDFVQISTNEIGIVRSDSGSFTLI